MDEIVETEQLLQNQIYRASEMANFLRHIIDNYSLDNSSTCDENVKGLIDMLEQMTLVSGGGPRPDDAESGADQTLFGQGETTNPPKHVWEQLLQRVDAVRQESVEDLERIVSLKQLCGEEAGAKSRD